ncbi:tail fiber assembly protein, partial [Escherichia coli]|nr:tail fiber assembly protein [Escherichia coli]EHR8528239.1 tail fiber assembly protein [Escherichia coli]EHZ4759820.1 tail fiber assembly protein [Escherichia coli]
MMHLKNITAQNPKTIEQYQLARQHKFLLWLFSDDGQEWHEAQEKFQPDTLKVIYTETGEVVWVGKDITSICPENKSVIELPDITANRRIEASGYWFYRNDEFVFDHKLKAEDELNA